MNTNHCIKSVFEDNLLLCGIYWIPIEACLYSCHLYRIKVCKVSATSTIEYPKNIHNLNIFICNFVTYLKILICHKLKLLFKWVVNLMTSPTNYSFYFEQKKKLYSSIFKIIYNFTIVYLMPYSSECPKAICYLFYYINSNN